MRMLDACDEETKANFRAHVRKLERLALAGDEDSVRSLACMALLGPPEDDEPDPGEEDDGIVYLSDWKQAA